MTTLGDMTPAGWYPAPEGPFERWWDGTQWTEHTRPTATTVAPPAAPVYAVTNPAAPAYAVTKTRKRTSHGLHLFLTIVTLGAWGVFVWLPITIWHAWGPKRREVTHYR